MTKQEELLESIKTIFNDSILSLKTASDEITLEISPLTLKSMMTQLRDHPLFLFEQLIDLCGVDYLTYGKDDWKTESATETGFSRAVKPVDLMENKDALSESRRFAVVYHLLSVKKNQRLRVMVFLEGADLILPSVHDIWKVANWYEREAYDLYGILFEDHPDLRRLLTDYGFIGHPFRKDFPLSGYVEMRYDAALAKVIYEPVDIEPRIGVPRVIRDDNRYLFELEK